MKYTTLIVATALALATAACSGEPAPTPTVTVQTTHEVTVTQTATVTVEPEPVETEAAQSSGGIPAPDATQSAALLSDLGAIDSRMDHERSIDRARNMCDAMLAEARGEGGNYTLVELVKLRFYDDLSDGQAQSVIDVIAAGGWCA